MDSDKEKREALKWAKKGGAYVKATYGRDGKNELVISGDVIALLRIAERILTRIGDITGNGFLNTWLILRSVHDDADKSEVIEQGQMMPYEGRN